LALGYLNLFRIQKFGFGISRFTLTLILSHSPYPSGSKSSLDACPPFLPRERKKVEFCSLPWRERVRVRGHALTNRPAAF
jgi:hypothetical protein